VTIDASGFLQFTRGANLWRLAASSFSGFVALEGPVSYLVAQAGFVLAQDSTSGTTDGSSLLGLLLPLVILGGLFYFVLIRPQRRRVRQMEELREAVTVGDEIRTIGGIYAIVKSIEGTDMVVDIGGGTSMRITRRAVAERIGGDAE